ncbi:hypothetical protein VN12_02305 [Pirellula sp. SH-Sr6A]|nr:hypothetical protein VN12_02305 [Pirellula sp. SH-Sr6A]
MECEYLNNGSCAIASDLACMPVSLVAVTKEACDHCKNIQNAMTINEVTVSVAIAALRNNNLFDQVSHRHLLDIAKSNCPKEVFTVGVVKSCGVGSVLARKLSWFHRTDDPCKICRYRVSKMNEWGPEGCERNMETILVWLKHSANKRGIPFFKAAVKLVVQSAINEERRNGCCVKT